MAKLSDIVSVNIALETTGVKGGDFGTGMIVAPLMTFSERVRTYGDYAEAAEDGLPPSVLTAVSDYFSQTPQPRQVKVGRRAVLKAVIEPSSLIPLGVYSFTVDAKTYTFTASASPTASAIATGLAANVTADSTKIITATVVGNTIEIAFIGTSLGSVKLVTNLQFGLISPLAASTATADDLTAILDSDSGWYSLILTERVKQAQLDAAEWTEANKRLFLTATSESTVLESGTTTDLISTLKNTRYFRTAAVYHTNAATEYPDAAWAGRISTLQPGSETWALKALASITPSTLTSSNRSTIYGKGGNTFEYINDEIALIGVGVQGNGGRVVAGEWIDVIRFRDWLENYIQINMVQMMINRPKVPYTDPGIQMVVANLNRSLQEGVNVGGISPPELDSAGATVPSYIITAPRSADLTANTKASRILTIAFKARLAGAIHLVNINGSLAYTF
jgi:hypothetical protein